MISSNCRSCLRLAVFAVALLLLFYVAAVASEVKKPVITGTVFADKNANGDRDAGEKALPGVAVSDGISIMLTDLEGRFAIPSVDSAISHFVFVITPTGYHAANFYKRLPTDKVDFGLTPSPNTKRSKLIFADITDIHVSDESKTFYDDLKEIESLKPAFIIATGDLTNTAERSQFKLYREAILSVSAPVISVTGNHDCPNGSATNYEDYLGPTYYSFDWGTCHFVVLNSVFDWEQQIKWLKKDLSLLGRGKDVIVVGHYAPDINTMNILAQYGAKAFLSGHWHSNKTYFPGGVAYVNSPPLRFGGIDTSPRGFRLITVADHKLSIADHYSGCKRYFTVVSPVDGNVIAGRKLTILAKFYDTTSSVVRAEYCLDGSPWVKMTASYGWNWEAHNKVVKPGLHSLKICVILDSDEKLTKELSFTVSGSEAAKVKPGCDWPMFKCGTARMSLSTDIVEPPLELSWSRSLGGTIHVSSPVTAGGFVYVGVADNEHSGKSGVYAMDAATVEVKWSYMTESPVRSTVALYGGNVYAMEISGIMHALNAMTGDLIWRYSLGGDVGRWVYSSPLAKNGVIYAGVAPNFVALDSKTGAKIWQAEPFGTDWISSLASSTAGRSNVYAGFNWNMAAYALDLVDGKKIWNLKGNWVHSTPAYFAGVLYLCVDNMLDALEAESGEQIWSFPMAMALSSPAVSGSRVYVGSSEGKLYSVDAAIGKELWSFQTGTSSLAFFPYSRDLSPIISSPAVSGNVVYFGSTDGRFYALDAASGKDLWSYNLGAPVTSSPAVSGNAVYIATFDGTVYAFTQPDRGGRTRTSDSGIAASQTVITMKN